MESVRRQLSTERSNGRCNGSGRGDKIGEHERRSHCPVEERLGINSDDEGSGESDIDHRTQWTRGLDGRGIERFADVHLLHDDQIVIHRHDDVDEADGDQDVEAFFDRGDKNI